MHFTQEANFLIQQSNTSLIIITIEGHFNNHNNNSNNNITMLGNPIYVITQKKTNTSENMWERLPFQTFVS
jgi:hypothetical protein